MRYRETIAAVWIAATLARPAVAGAWAGVVPSFEDRIAEADSLFAARKNDAALAILDSLLIVAGEIPSEERRLQVLLSQARLHSFAGRPRPGSVSASAALAIASARNDSLSMCKALRWLAVSMQAEGRTNEARLHANRLLTLSTSLGDRLHEGQALLLLGYDALMAGNPDDAASRYARAVSLLDEVGDVRFALMARTGLARVSHSRGEISVARQCYTQVLEGSRAIGDSYGEANALNNLGALEFTFGDPSAAEEYYRQAYQLQVSEGSPEGSIAPATNLAMTQAYMGEFEAAIQVLVRAEKVCESHGYRSHCAMVLEQMGAIRKVQGRLSDAAHLYRRALSQSDESPVDLTGKSLVGLAQTLVLRDSADAAMALLHERFEPIRRHVSPGICDLSERLQGEVDFRRGALPEALVHFHRSNRIARSMGLGFRVHPLTHIARTYSKMGVPDSARIYLRLAVDAWEAERGRIRDPHWREQLQLDGRLLYTELGRQALTDTARSSSAERAAAAFDAMQRFKARTLRERVLGNLAADSSLPADRLHTPVTIRELQDGVLGQDELLIDIFIGTDGIYLFGVTQTECRASRIPCDIRSFQNRLERYRDLVTSRPAANRSSDDRTVLEQAGASLSDLLLSPIAEFVHGRPRVIFALDGFLNMIPVESLPLPPIGEGHAPGGPILERKWVMRVPSATVLRDRRARMGTERPAGKGGAILAILGKPDSGMAELESAQGEVEWLRRSFRRCRVVRAGADSGSSGRIGDPARYDLLHLASHVSVDDRHPWHSGLPRLRARDIASMKLRARLAFLAGCESAGGRVVSGEGVLGLTAAFTAAGVPSVVATLWPVSDRATAELVRAFYGSLGRGHTVGDALRGAQRTVRDDPRTAHPFYWAGFVLVGESTSRVSLDRTWRGRLPLSLEIAVAALLGGMGGLWFGRRRRFR